MYCIFSKFHSKNLFNPKVNNLVRLKEILVVVYNHLNFFKKY